MSRVTLASVNRAIAEAGYQAELVKAREGYFYFTGDDVTLSRETIVLVYHLSALSVSEWVSELARIATPRSTCDMQTCVGTFRLVDLTSKLR